MDEDRRVPRMTSSMERLALGVSESVSASTATRDRETRHEKFKRLGNVRARRVITDLRKLGMLGTSYYERKPEDVDKIATVLVGEMQKCIQRLRVGMDEPVEDII